MKETPVISNVVGACIKNGRNFSLQAAKQSHSEPSGCLEGRVVILRPLLKGSRFDSNITGNYRPVSNLLFLSKVLEKVVATPVTKHLTENDLLDPFQSAYRAGHSTETALTRVKQDIAGQG